MKAWERFVVTHGRRAWAWELAAVLEQPADAIIRLRWRVPCSSLKKPKRFAELFSLWHGRAPRDDEWPAPCRAGPRRAYEWQPPEVALLASLVGRLDVAAIAKILRKRLRARTGDRRAERSMHAVQARIWQIGMQSRDVVGGITVRDAGREIGSYTIPFQAIRDKKLRAFRVGRLWVIPRDAWEAFKAERVSPPAGYVQLSKLRQPLGIRSDSKLPEFAHMGYVPTAVLCNPFRKNHSQRGSWWIDRKVALKLVADRRAGRPMPWHGKPMHDNLKQTFTLWRERKHPASCSTCAQIWGRKGAPRSYADYAERYPPLAFGAKRHLTRKWTPGLTVAEAARFVARPRIFVARAIENGVLAATRHGGRLFVSRTDLTRWKWRRCTTGDTQKSWISLATARKRYLFTRGELRAFIAIGKLRSKEGSAGPARGITYVLHQQCAELREKIGFSEAEAARRAKVSISKLRTLLRGADWRGQKGIPLVTVQAVIKRLQSREGYTIEAAAAKLGTTVQWIHDRIVDGTVRVWRAKWDRRRIYITEPALERLKQAKRHPQRRERLGSHWLLQSEAAVEAGVCSTMITRWARERKLARRRSVRGWRYHRASVRARARRYWRTCRYHRATPPAWLERRVRPASWMGA